jgi:hypothetical protein
MRKKGITRVAFALAVAGALGFGGSQAFAGPAPSNGGRACNSSECALFCYEGGAAYGWCSGGECRCFYN